MILVNFFCISKNHKAEIRENEPRACPLPFAVHEEYKKYVIGRKKINS